MKQIYDFESCPPPRVTEYQLQQRLAKRQLQWQLAILALAAILMQGITLAVGIAAVKVYPILAAALLLYVIICATGCGVLAVVCTRKGGMIYGSC